LKYKELHKIIDNMYRLEDVPLDLVGDMFAFLGGNVVGYIAEDQAIQTGNAWFSPDPVTNGRYVNLALGVPAAAIGVLGVMWGPRDMKYPFELLSLGGAGMATKGIADMIMKPTAVAAVRGISVPATVKATSPGLQSATPMMTPQVLAMKT